MSDRVDTPRDLPARTPPAPDGPGRFAAVGRLLQAITGDESDAPGVIPGLRIDRPIGTGGGGRVFRAFREGSDQPLALKILATPLGSGRASARVFREIDVLASLRLPAVARLLHHGTSEGRVWLATEFIDGPTLAEFGATVRGDTRRAVELLARVADAVQAVHERGIIHRDLKPGNVIITGEDQPVLVDFGLAALIEDHAQTLTTEGAALGTPAYMAPEQARGDRAAISTRTDVYGLGAIACWVLTGATPYDTECSLHEALRRVGHEPPRDPRELRRDLPRALGAVIAKATAADPARRYASAAEFAADLRRWLRGEPVTAVAPGVWQKAVRWVGRHPVMATGGACGALAVFMIGGAIALTDWQIQRRMSEPARFVPLSNGGVVWRATLVSRAGNELGSVGGSSKDDNVLLATLEPWPGELPDLNAGSQVAIIAIQNADDRVGTRGQVWVCDPLDLTKPLRSGPAKFSPPPSPDGYRKLDPGACVLQRVILANIYADVPGPELIVIGDTGREQTADVIFVQDLQGNVLFEAWHFGHLSDAEWWPEQRLLVLSGDRHGQQTHRWTRMDAPDAKTVAEIASVEPYPRVVFGVRIDARGKHGWLRDSRDAAIDDVSGPLAWYKALWPPRGSVMFNSDLSQPSEIALRSSVMELRWKCNTDEFPPSLGTDHEPAVGLPVGTRIPMALDRGDPVDNRLAARAAAWKTWVPTATRWDAQWSMCIDATGSVVQYRAPRPDGWKRNFTDGEEGAKRAEAGFSLVDFPTGVPGWREAP